MKKIVYLFTIALLLSSAASYSQLSGLKNKLLKPKENTTAQPAPPPQQSSSEANTQSSDGGTPAPAANSSAAPATSGGGKKVDFKQHPFPPGILLSKLLDGGFRNGSNGQAPYFHVNKIILLPLKYEGGGDVDYNCDNPLISGIIRQGDKIISSQYFYPNDLTLPSAPLLNCRGGGKGIAPPATGLEAGEYYCEILLDGRLIFSMPFEMVHMKNSDVYAEDREYKFIDGYWSKYAFISSTPEGFIRFNHYESNTDRKFVANGARKSKVCEFELQLFYNGQPISTPEKDTRYFPRGEWEFKSYRFLNIKNGTEALLLADLKDGAYTVKMKVNEEQREYPFTMAGGKPVLIAEQDRAKTTEPSKVFEGMNNEFWIKRTK